MSDTSRKAPSGGVGPRRRQRGPARPSKRAASTVVPPVQPAETDVKIAAAGTALLPARSPRLRRGGGVPIPTFTLSRAQEMAYIRSDMQRLFVIAGALLALMLVILLFSNR